MLIKLNNPPYRAKAKTCKKQKSGPPKIVEAYEQENQAPKVGEAQTQELEDTESRHDDQPPQGYLVNPDLAVDVNNDPATNQDPPTPKPPSPVKHSDKPSADDHIEEVIITGTAYQPPGVSTALAKHSTKEESNSSDKDKPKLDLENDSKLNAGELYSGYLSRLHTSRDLEANLVNMM